MRYLGFIVQKKELRVDLDKVRPVQKYPLQQNLKQLRRFMGMASWYRRFISQFVTVTALLTALTRKNTHWQWTAARQNAFKAIKKLTAPILTCPDFEKPFALQTNASAVELEVVFIQEFDGNEWVIVYASCALLDAETFYGTIERVLSRGVGGQKISEGYTFTVMTNYSSLRWLHDLKNPEGKLARWTLELLEYSYEVLHRKGAQHHLPDALLRIPKQTEDLTGKRAQNQRR